MKMHIFSWYGIIQEMLSDFNEKKSKFVAEKSLQNAIEKYIKGPET
jgi:hypothetical protein